MRIPYRVAQTLTNSRYSKWMQVKSSKLPIGDKRVVFDMRHLIPDRRTVQVFLQLRHAGYSAYLLIPNYCYWLKAAFLHNWRYSEILFDNAVVIHKLPETYDLLVTKKGVNNPGRKTLFIDDRNMENIAAVTDEEFFYPILLHPSKLKESEEYRGLQCPTSNRKISVLFVGNLSEEYDKHGFVLRRKYGVHSRSAVIRHLKEKCGQYIVEPASYDELICMADEGSLQNKIVIVDRFRVDGENYFGLLGMSRYHLHTAGVIIPYCHNQIESAVCGCVPITELTKFFPGLIDSENCLTFASLEELEALCKRICEDVVCNTSEAICQSDNIRQWYIDHWSFQSFDAKIGRFIDSEIQSETYYIFKELSEFLEKIEKWTGMSF